jgi:DNA polymerase III subunit epsilon
VKSAVLCAGPNEFLRCIFTVLGAKRTTGGNDLGNYGVVVLDFETTGLSPDCGDRTIEVGAVLVQENKITDRFQSLMNPGMRVSSFIEQYTGITNLMLKTAPPAEEVMRRFADFMGRHHLVAHNASFDKRFLDAELKRISLVRKQEFACSMLISRRLNADAPGHSLETLVRYKQLTTNGVFHRALADAEMTAYLWMGMVEELKRNHQLKVVPFELMQRLMKMTKGAVPNYLQRLAQEQ